MGVDRPLAAFWRAGDPNAPADAETVPRGARIKTVGNAVVGYKHGAALPKRAAFPRLRLSEIERIITRRHGGACDTDDGLIYLSFAIPLIVETAGRAKGRDRVARWAHAFTPLVGPAEVEALMAAASGEPQRLTAQQFADALRVTSAERKALRLRTCGCIDLEPDERRAQSREDKRRRDRERAAAKRRAAGSEPRSLYEGRSIAKAAAAMGLSRFQLMRRLRKATETAPHRSVANQGEPSVMRDAHVRGARDYEEIVD